MVFGSNVAVAAALLADPARIAMLTALIDGRALPAGELASVSGVTPQTASGHLAKLLGGGMIEVETEGRHRYYRLAGPDVAEAIEHLAAIRPPEPLRRRSVTRIDGELKFARRCYDHLAGELGVAVTQGLVGRGYILPAADKRFDLTADGAAWLGGIGLDVGGLKPTRRGLARQCLDWTERRHHLAGPLGVQLMSLFCAKGWLRRSGETRAMQLTPVGRTELRQRLGV